MTPGTYTVTDPLTIPSTEIFRIYFLPGVTIKQECDYLFKLNATLNFLNITGGTVEIGKNAEGFVTGGTVIPNITDIVFKNVPNEYASKLQSVQQERCYIQSV